MIVRCMSVARIFRRRFTSSPLEIRCSEVASESILGQKQSVLTKIARLQVVQFQLHFGGGLLEGQLVNSRAPEIAIIIYTSLRALQAAA